MAGLRIAAMVIGVLSGAAAWGVMMQPGLETARFQERTMRDKGGPIYSKSGHDITPLSTERINGLAESLSPEEAKIILRKGTERAFCGNLLDNKIDGVYVCRLCGLPLFDSQTKFTSGTGWPSFFSPVDDAHIRYIRDVSFGMARTEILCARSGSHLGHVFDDGPAPTGKRYCLNSASLVFHAKGTELPPASRPVATKTAYFAGGCFWGVEDRFQQLPGVINAVSGYQGGEVENPTYKQVCSGESGHAESVRVVFDPNRVTYGQLLEFFFKIHDPTQLNRQGPDFGSQYRSAIFAADAEQLAEAKAFVQRRIEQPLYAGKKVVTVVEPADRFYEAEERHQDYHAKHGGSCPIPGD